VVQDRVPQARLYMVWNAPGWGSPEATWLDLATDVLSSGKSSRLYKRLVYDDQIATSVAAYISEQEIGGQVTIRADVKPGGDLAAVEKAVREELERLMKDGPTADELDRAKVQYRAGFTRGAERIGGFGGKSDILASNEVYGGDPAFYKTRLAREEAATAEQVRKSVVDWMSDGVYVLEVHPFAGLAAAGVAADRSKLPEVATPPVPKFASYETRTLANGLSLVVARRDSVPVVDLDLLLDAGFAADQGGVPGTASLAMAALDEGTRTRSALEISDALDRLGASLSTGSGVDSSYVSLSALKETLDPALDILADIVLNPSFPEADVERVRKQQVARIRREKVSPNQMAMRVMPVLLYGKGHAYGQPLTGSGTEASVASLTRDQLARFHQTWFKPGSATLVVTGAISMAEIAPRIERVFAGWKAGKAPAKTLGTVADKPRPEVYIVDRPDSQQSVIFAGHLAPPKNNPEERAIETVNQVFGGAFVSRLNMNLREDKHWSYGAGSFFRDARGQRPFLVYTSVQADKTKESLQEVVKELRGVAGEKPLTADELAMAQSDLTLSLPGRWETNQAVAGSLAEIVTFGLARDYFDTYAAAVRSLTLANANAVARKVFRPDNAVYVVVGDRSKIEAGIRELNLGEVRLIDADGQPAAPTAGRK
jgi:zinc protease